MVDCLQVHRRNQLLHLYLWVLSVSLLALPEPGVDEVKVLLEVGLLLPHERLVELEEPRPVQALQVQPTSPPHTHAVQDKRTGDVHFSLFPVEITE